MEIRIIEVLLYYAFNHLLELKWIAVLYGIDQFLFESVATAIQKLWPFSRVMHEERKMVIGNMQLQTAL